MKTNDKLYSMILAAGKGSRMKSNLPKVMHSIAEKPMLKILLNTVQSCNISNNIIIISDEDHKFITKKITTEKFAIQKERLGTAHAASIALKSLQAQLTDDVSGVLFYMETRLLLLKKQF
jgi:bifunctional UDP-N-acetylglucosamine pyrophosphorylase/glucosamine-1-phosphate N-acetyltransferase